MCPAVAMILSRTASYVAMLNVRLYGVPLIVCPIKTNLACRRMNRCPCTACCFRWFVGTARQNPLPSYRLHQVSQITSSCPTPRVSLMCLSVRKPYCSADIIFKDKPHFQIRLSWQCSAITISSHCRQSHECGRYRGRRRLHYLG